MKISTRGRYALRMMVELARNQGDGYLSLTEIAESQGISKKYLEQIIPLLSHASYLRTARGLKGGYRLSRAPSEYKVGDVLRLTEGSLALVPIGRTSAINAAIVRRIRSGRNFRESSPIISTA